MSLSSKVRSVRSDYRSKVVAHWLYHPNLHELTHRDKRILKAAAALHVKLMEDEFHRELLASPERIELIMRRLERASYRSGVHTHLGVRKLLEYLISNLSKMQKDSQKLIDRKHRVL